MLRGCLERTRKPLFICSCERQAVALRHLAEIRQTRLRYYSCVNLCLKSMFKIGKRLNSRATDTTIERRSLPILGGILRRPKTDPKQAEPAEKTGKTYLKAMPLRDLSDLNNIKEEVRSGNVLILRITQLANRSVDDVKRAVSELTEFVESIGGDIARLGEERIVVCPSTVRVWREKAPVAANEPIPTAA